jgi:hypothetical protein
MQFALSLLIIAVTALVVYAIIKTNPAKPMPLPPPGKPREARLPDTAPVLHWSDQGRYQVEVVNESKYAPVLAALAALRTDYVATLVPDDGDPYDSQAVTVFLDGRMAGYLSRKAALRLRELLRAKEISGMPTTCDAQIRGGGSWEGKRLAYVVALDIEPLE